jgi:hypothetical protein
MRFNVIGWPDGDHAVIVSEKLDARGVMSSVQFLDIEKF